MIKPLKLVFAVFVGMALGIVVLLGWQSLYPSKNVDAENKEKKPLYWVAPMDSNYRRDGPGKSPMGMDLVPVYESSESQLEAGTVEIAPHVVNNLGVRTQQAEYGELKQQVTAFGQIQYDETKIFHVHPRVNGWIENLYVHTTGESVAKGQALYTLYSPQLVNAQEELLIALKRKDKRLIRAAKERLQALHLPKSFITELQQNQQVQQTVTFYSPHAGVVEGLNIREGFYVNPGDTLFSIANLDTVWLEVDIFAIDVSHIREQQNAVMTLDYWPDKTWQGKLEYIYPSLNPQTRTLRVRLSFANTAHELKPEMFAKVQIDVSDENNSNLLVPNSAVIRTGQQNRVVVETAKGQYKSVEVMLGRQSPQQVEILEGLLEGDTVVISAQFLIDSESSKTSDFKRMSAQTEAKNVWMEGEINSIDSQSRVANISHAAVEQWQWPEMTMDFNLDSELNIDSLKAGQTIHFEVTNDEVDGYLVTTVHIMTEPDFPSAEVTGQINHIDVDSRVLNISRDAIEKWGRGPATMDFVADELIDLTGFQIGDQIQFEFEIRDDFVITFITKLTSKPTTNEAGLSEVKHHD